MLQCLLNMYNAIGLILSTSNFENERMRGNERRKKRNNKLTQFSVPVLRLVWYSDITFTGSPFLTILYYLHLNFFQFNTNFSNFVGTSLFDAQ